MTDEQMIEFAESCGFEYMDTTKNYLDCSKDQLLKFAQLMYNKGKEEEIRRQKTGIGYVNDVLFVDEF